MRKSSKRFTEAQKQVDVTRTYTLPEAVAVLKKLPALKFDASVDLHFDLNVDPKKSEQMVRGTVILPHGTGKNVRVAVFCKGEHEKIARDAKAEFVGAQELIDKVNAGFLDFDCVIATPDMMKDLSRLGKVLGPRGLMPSPKTGTVTNDIAKAIEEVRKGKVEFRVDKQRGLHLSVGKISFPENAIVENASTVINAINDAKPSTVKGKFVKTLYISSTMNPGLNLGA